jgi:hypothetical protein
MIQIKSKPKMIMMIKKSKIPISAMLLLLFFSCSQRDIEIKTFDTLDEWESVASGRNSVLVLASIEIDGNFDLMSNGALLLEKRNDEGFYKTDHFVRKGTWTSEWMELDDTSKELEIEMDWFVYGKPQDMQFGWKKFDGNPLVCEGGWHHATEQTLQLPDSLPGQPADQSLLRGKGRWEGKWLLIFNVGGWAVNGWGMAVADSLAPLKRGINPFRLAEPFPLVTAEQRGGKHAPNDWLYAKGIWYSPDETDPTPDDPAGPFVSYMWTSPDLIHWQNNGPIDGMMGHDPGICYDGELFHLFNEDGEKIVHCQTKDPLGRWEYTGDVLGVGDHTGDADPVFFNNAWHMFFDDAPHRHYQIGYAIAQPSNFPTIWELTNDIFGPHNPDQGHVWDDDTPAGNDFGTGDPDVAIEGTTLYMTHEWPVGIAWKELDVSADGQKVYITVQVDENGDGKWDWKSEKIPYVSGKTAKKIDLKTNGKMYRIEIELNTTSANESPLANWIKISA